MCSKFKELSTQKTLLKIIHFKTSLCSLLPFSPSMVYISVNITHELNIVSCQAITQLRGSGSGLSLGGPIKVNSRKSSLFTEGSLKIKIKNTWFILLLHWILGDIPGGDGMAWWVPNIFYILKVPVLLKWRTLGWFCSHTKKFSEFWKYSLIFENHQRFSYCVFIKIFWGTAAV